MTYRILEGTRYDRPSDRWRRMASELVREHFFAGLDADAILFSSMFEGFGEDIVTSAGDLCSESVRAVIAYDLIPLLYPKKYLDSPITRTWYEEKLSAFRKAELFLAISASAGREVAEHLGVNANNIAAIMGGADEFALDHSAAQHDKIDLDSRFGISLPFFIYAATFEARKNFESLIAAFGRFASQVDRPHQLVLVTSNSVEVGAAIAGMAKGAGLAAGDIIVTGPISDVELKQLYRRCVALVYPSFHEGLGLPILEAMHLDAAVIGSNTSSIPEIIGLEEALFDPHSIGEIADKMIKVAQDDAFRMRLQKNAVARRKMFSWDKTASAAWHALERACAARGRHHQHRNSRSRRYHMLLAALRGLPAVDSPPDPCERRALANAIAANMEAIDALPLRTPDNPKRVWRIEGPFDSTYSLALLNRETARALKAKGEDVVLHSTEGPGDFSPNEGFLARDHSDILALWRASPKTIGPGRTVISTRNLYPPRVNDADGDYSFLHHYAWEESRFPSEWVDQFNLHLNGITCLSSHVKKVLQDSGVMVPLSVSGCGVDHWERVTPTRRKSFPGKSFRFLHVSSCFPRKGADVLLAAYGKAFRRTDDVSLLIKTFENPHNEIRSQLEAARAADADFPDVILLFDELSDPELKALYQHCHVVVAPSRAEGYGLPMAEAMLSGIPVITTGWSGQLDFCNEETAWLVDFRFAPARTHFGLSASVWAEPDPDDLTARLREACQATPAERARKAAAGRSLLMKGHTWSAVIGRLSAAVDGWTKPRRRNTTSYRMDNNMELRMRYRQLL